jgi:hypothetical protein
VRPSKPRKVGLAIVLVSVFLAPPGCGPEGAGSVHVDRATATRGVALIPDRKDPGPPPKSHGGRHVPRPIASRR